MCNGIGTREFQDRGKGGLDHFVPWILDDPSAGDQKIGCTNLPRPDKMIEILKLRCMQQ